MEAKKTGQPTWQQLEELEKKVSNLEEALSLTKKVSEEVEKELNQKLDEYAEVLHDRCQEADGWREKFRDMKATADKLLQEISIKEDEIKSVKNTVEAIHGENNTLRENLAKEIGNNKILMTQNELLTKRCKKCEELSDKRLSEIMQLRSRSPWKVFKDWLRG